MLPPKKGHVRPGCSLPHEVRCAAESRWQKRSKRDCIHEQQILFLLKKHFIAVLAIAGLFLAIGCSKESSTVSKPEEQRQTLMIGLVPEQSLFKQARRYEPIAEYLSMRLDMDIHLAVMPTYEQVLTNIAQKKLDGAFLGSLSYILCRQQCGIEVLARPEDLDGHSTYYGVVIVRRDSNIHSVKEVRGKRFAFVDKYTTAGYLLPLAYFKKWQVDYRTYLKEYYFAGTHEDVIYDVIDRKADIGAVKSSVLNRLADEDPRVKNNLIVLSRTIDVPENSLAVRRDLPQQIKEQLKLELLRMHDDPEGRLVLKSFKARRFVETTDRDFRSVYLFARELGVDLSGKHAPSSP